MTGSLDRLALGGNNRIFRATCDDGSAWVVKVYFRSRDDGRDRFDSERRFYRFAHRVAAGWVPRNLGWDVDASIGLFEQIDGRRPQPGDIGEPEIASALAFFQDLNSARKSAEAADLPLGAEACFSVEQHLEAVDRRLEYLQAAPVTSPLELEAKRFVVAELLPAWRRTRALAAGEASGRKGVEPDRCVSPSDFGFHNCLRRNDGSLVFFDFEYAGWDDAAKMVCDFFCQPAVPVPPGFFDRFSRDAAEALEADDPNQFIARCRSLLPVYRIKWCGIMLNEFMPGGRERRSFAQGNAAAARQERQLAAARSALAALTKPH
jgi:hypothetical protein